MSTITKELSLAYIVHKIKLNKILTDEKIPLNSPIVYITKKPIAMTAKINDPSNGAFDLTRVSIIELPNRQLVKSLFITTTVTSTEQIEIITSDHRIFSDIGIENSVVLIDTSGVEYDARDVQQLNAELAAQIAVRDTALDTYNLDISGFRAAIFAFYSSLDQAGTLKYYGSVDGVKYHQIGSDIAIVDGSSTEQIDIQSVSDSWKFIRVTFKPSVNPTTGSYTIEYSLKT